jgi:uncharacterized protein involved in exopolysaccharide biosynthesis
MSSRDLPGDSPDDAAVDSDFSVPAFNAEVVHTACLQMMGGREAGKIFALVHGESIIGRGASAQIRIEDGAISTRHAKVVWDGKRHILVDMGSTNGTFLNGTRLGANASAPLSFGDSVQVADIVLAYLESPQDTHRHTQALALISPQLPGSQALRIPDAELIAQLLQSTNPAQDRPAPGAGLDELIEKATRILAFLRRNWVTLFASAALFTLAGVGTVVLYPPATQAVTRLRITMKAPGGDVFEQRTLQREEIERFSKTAEQNFLSTPLVEQTLKAIGNKQPTRQDTIIALARLKFESVAYSMYEGSYTDYKPDYAYRFLSAHLKNFLAAEVQRTVRGIQAEVDFVTGRLKESEQELRRTEGELQAFKAKHMEGLPDREGAHFATREQLMLRRADLTAEVERSNLALAEARRRLREEVPLSALKMQNAAPYEQSLIETRRKLGEAKAKGYGPQHPEVLALTKQLSELEAMATQARSSTATDLDLKANPGLTELRNRERDFEVASRGAAAALGQINGQLARLDKIWENMPEVEAQYAQLTRVYSASRELHAKLFERLRTSQVQLELERSSAAARYEIVAPPEAAGVPLRSAVFKRGGMGLAGGLAIGLVVALCIELRRYLQRRRTSRNVGLARVPQRNSLARSDGLQDANRA